MSSSSSVASSNRLESALGALQALNIPFRGPFITPRKNRIYVVDDCILTEAEIVALHDGDKLKPGSVSRLFEDLRLRQRTSGHGRQSSQLQLQDRRRNERFMLRLDILVRLEISAGTRVQTHAFTVTVSAYGGQLVSPFRMNANHEITLVNPETGREVPGRVVGADRNAEGDYLISFAFDHLNPTFWPVAFIGSSEASP